MDYTNAERLVKQARQFIKRPEELDVAVKGENDFVTNTDLNVSTFLEKELKKFYPETGFFSEEKKGSLQEDCWILDPIDGTTNLIYGYNLSSISLAHYKNGEILFGIVYNPFTEEVFTAEKGKGAWFNHSRQLKTSNRPLKKALVEFGAGSTHKENTDKNFALVKDVFRACVDVRRICSSALDLCYIADQRIDGYFEKVLKPWDIAAGSLILSEAGGKLSDYQGQPVQFAKPTSVVAANSSAFDDLLAIVQKHEC